MNTTTTKPATATFELIAVRREDRPKCFRYHGHFADGSTILLRESGNRYTLAAVHTRHQVTKYPGTDPRAFITLHATTPKASRGDAIVVVRAIVTDAIPAPKLTPFAQAVEDERAGNFAAAGAGYRIAGDQAGGHTRAAECYAAAVRCKALADAATAPTPPAPLLTPLETILDAIDNAGAGLSIDDVDAIIERAKLYLPY